MKRLILIAAAMLLVLPGAFAQEQEAAPRINKKNLVIKEWNTDARSNHRVLDHQTIFNADGRKVEETEYNSEGQKWRKRYEYGENGKVSRELVYNDRNRLYSVKKFEYNEFGRKKTQYTYDAKGRLKTIKVFEYITEDD
jgi:YD repeat-containing protein